MFDSEIVILKGDSPSGQHVRIVLPFIEVCKCLVVSTACEMLAPYIWTPVGDNPKHSTTLFHGRATTTLAFSKAVTAIRYNVKIGIGATFVWRFSEKFL